MSVPPHANPPTLDSRDARILAENLLRQLGGILNQFHALAMQEAERAERAEAKLAEMSAAPRSGVPVEKG